MEAKTYTNRNNARRAGVAAGVPAELVEITVHKNGDEVRFGWKAKQPPASAAQGAASTPAATATESEPVAPAVAVQGVTTSKAKKAAAPKVEREERNGVKRPRAGGLCAAVWAWLDAHPGATIKDAKLPPLTTVGTRTTWPASFTSGGDLTGCHAPPLQLGDHGQHTKTATDQHKAALACGTPPLWFAVLP
ncbi:hypothetical protein U0039_14990 [Stenotrophomonas maltophilia]|uniref:hypothetical protein n=1 Tax=Stenotrophomonas maltophilia TaxID=40324 RepID=UPI002E0F9A80|nr:hypothetical protein U0039_14990 [Stenotrophomonas maltophilia]